ncbi:MAG: hypothetical protein CMP56_00125 [Flavobacteriales bacterium]|nr:hypothetical protein [Flavobacteriales bacterium]
MKHILIISNKAAFPSSDGGAIAIKSLCENLISKNYQLDIVAINKSRKQLKKPIETKINKKITQIVFMKRMNFNIVEFSKSLFTNTSYQASRFYSEEIRFFIQSLIDQKKYKYIIFESIFTTVYLQKLKISNVSKLILRAHNVEHRIWQDLAKNSVMKKIFFLFMSSQIKSMETTMPKHIDYIFTLSTLDQKYFSSIFPEKTYNIPVTFNTDYTPSEKIKNTIVHLGAMNWMPNIEGINWFINEVLPRIKKISPTIKTHIAGKGMPEKYFNYNDENTVIEGKIDNAKNYILNKEIMFVPLFSGSGIRIKILEGMSFGMPVISTSKGAEGIPYSHLENIIIANTTTEFFNAISLLIENKKLAKKIGKNGQLLIKKYFSKKFVINQLNNIID